MKQSVQKPGEGDQFTLVSSEIAPAYAKEQLLSLLGENIDYHNRKNFSSQERLGTSDIEAENMLKNLNQSKERILELIEVSKKQRVNLKIESYVKVSLESPSH